MSGRVKGLTQRSAPWDQHLVRLYNMRYSGNISLYAYLGFPVWESRGPQLLRVSVVWLWELGAVRGQKPRLLFPSRPQRLGRTLICALLGFCLWLTGLARWGFACGQNPPAWSESARQAQEHWRGLLESPGSWISLSKLYLQGIR